MDPQVTTLEIAKPEQKMFKSAENALSSARAYEIDSASMRDMAARELVSIKTMQKKMEESRKTITQPIDAAKKAVMDLFRAPTDYLDQAESILKTAIGTYDRAQEKLRIAEQARLEEAARKERARIEQETAVREAAAREEKAKLEAAAEAASKAGNDQEAARLSAEATSREEQGAAEIALLQQTSTLITAPMAAPMRQTAGVSARKVWKAEVNDKLALVRYVAEHPEYLELLDANMPSINRIALALKAQCPIKGVRVFEDSQLAVRAA